MTVPQTMTAIEIAEPGGPEVLRAASRPTPTPATGEVLIQVAAAGINRPDIMQRKGQYPPPPGASDIPGLEIAGKVVAVGLGVNHLRIGDEVCALVTGGGYASYCVAPEPQCLPVPKGFSMVEAAAMPETFFTVWHNVFERGRLVAGESILVHGGTSGIGTVALQLAKAFNAGAIFATAGSRDKCHACEKLGATRGIDYKHEDFVAVIKQATANRGVDVVLDMIGGDYIQKNLEHPRGRGPPCQHRDPARRGRRGQFRPGDGQAFDPDRIGAPPAQRSRERRDGGGAQAEGLAAARRRQGEAGDPQDLPVNRGRRSAAAARKLEPYRQDRADDLRSQLGEGSAIGPSQAAFQPLYSAYHPKTLTDA